MTETPYDDIPVIGELTDEEIIEKLRELEPAIPPDAQGLDHRSGVGLISLNRPWRYTAHTFGFIPNGSDDEQIAIEHAGAIDPDSSLRGQQIRITIDRLRVADYPGFGLHHILVDFSGRNQTDQGPETLHFNNLYKVREGQQGAVLGYPIFDGLTVGDDGVAFRCFTVNVKNEGDKAFLNFLESDVFRAGLELATTAQPAIAPLSTIAYELIKRFAVRYQNMPVQSFYLGLDFSDIATRAHLREGSYIAVQIPAKDRITWNWQDWIYDMSIGHIVKAGSDIRELIPYNYIIFSVSRS